MGLITNQTITMDTQIQIEQTLAGFANLIQLGQMIALVVIAVVAILEYRLLKKQDDE